MRNITFLLSVALTIATGHGVAGAAEPLTEAERRQAGRDGAQLAGEVADVATLPGFVEGGENDAGRLVVDGEEIDVNKILPGSDGARAGALFGVTEDGGDLEEMRLATEAREQELARDTGAEGSAERVRQASEDNRALRDQINNDTAFWQPSLDAIDDASDGNVLGEVFADCDSTYTPIEREVEEFINEERMCDRVRSPSAAPVCTREYVAVREENLIGLEERADIAVNGEVSRNLCRREVVATSRRDPEARVQDALLNMSAREGQLICRRTVTPASNAVTEAGSRTRDLNVNDEVGGLSCERTAWPEATAVAESGTHLEAIGVDGQTSTNICSRTVWPTSTTALTPGVRGGELSISTEVGGLACVREVWPTSGTGSVAGSKDATLGVSVETGGEVCRRERTALSAEVSLGSFSPVLPGLVSPASTPLASYWHDLSSIVPAGTQRLSGFDAELESPQSCRTLRIIEPPTLANGWRVNYRVRNQAPCAPAAQLDIRYSFEALKDDIQFGISESGNCGDPGTASCPTLWSCAASAPTTLGGVEVTAAQVGALAPLFPGAGGACVDGRLSRVCSGTWNGTTDVSIAADLPGGTTSITGFTFAVLNPQPGVDVTLVQTPAAVNAWVARFNISRSTWGAAPAQPQVRLSWNAGTTTVTTAVRNTGDCSDPGSSQCPTSWACSASAPTVLNGISVTGSMTASHSPLFPGAASTCAVGRLSRVCSGSADSGSTISIATALPPGTTSIEDFQWFLLNPQAGVSVSLVSAPTSANGWVASFAVKRTNFSYTPEQPMVSLSWNARSPATATSVVDTGSCATGSATANCPLVWSCTANAPTTINGLPVTTGMAATHAPLFPGASVTCAAGSLDRACSGSAPVDSTISIASKIPGGVTTIRDFTWAVQNPQPGVSVSLLQAPSMANGWIATFRSVKTDFSAKDMPLLKLDWAMDRPGVTMSVQDVGNCGDTGSGACPTQWACTTSAPVTINGISVTGALAGQVAPLFPGAASSCAIARLSRVCSGSTVVNNTIGIGDLIPAGVTSIFGVGFEVENPQAGVAVAMTQAPSSANGWTASFTVTRNMATAPSAPAQPRVRLFWELTRNIVTGSVVTTGDCSGNGDAVCPAAWSCTTSAPAVIGGLTVTPELAAGFAPLFPGASSSCVVGEKRTTCTGSEEAMTEVDLSAQIPTWQTTIRGLTWSVLNPRLGVTVDMVQVPALENGWIARFRVNRNYTQAPIASPPQVRITWEVDGPEIVEMSVTESGDCTVPAETTCAAQWSCSASAPATIGGLLVTPERMAELGISLYPGAGACVSASFDLVCSGAGGLQTSVDLSARIPEGTEELIGYTWEVSRPVSGVDVVQVQAPALGNGWVAIFESRRQGWSTAPVGVPEVLLRWQVRGPDNVSVTIVETGDCSIEGDEFCSTRWRCDLLADEGDEGGGGGPVLISTGSQSLRVLPPQSDGAVERHTVSIAGSLPTGTQSISAFRMEVVTSNPVAFPRLVQVPAVENGWVAIVEDTGECRLSTIEQCMVWYSRFQVINLTWENRGAPAEYTGGGEGGDGRPSMADLVGADPLYPGAPAMCIKASKVYDCSGINGGEICITDRNGVQQCETVGGGEFNGCADLESNPDCTFNRSVCTEGGMGTNGFCYVGTDVFLCRTRVTGTEVGVVENRVCSGTFATCLDGSCTAEEQPQDEMDGAGMRKAMANLALRQAILSDYTDPASTGTGGGGGPGPGDPPPPTEEQ